MYQKIDSSILDQPRGDMVSGPDQLDNNTLNQIDELIQSVTSQGLSLLRLNLM